jgi:hypothetical protein
MATYRRSALKPTILVPPALLVGMLDTNTLGLDIGVFSRIWDTPSTCTNLLLHTFVEKSWSILNYELVKRELFNVLYQNLSFFSCL